MNEEELLAVIDDVLDDDNQYEELPYNAELRVKQGAVWLDEKYGPGWTERVNLSQLSLNSPCRCVLGQVYKTSTCNGWDRITADEPEPEVDGLNLPQARKLGFLWHPDVHDQGREVAALELAWNRLIQARSAE